MRKETWLAVLRRVSVVLLAAGFALFCASCSFRMQPIEELMRPPLPFGDNEKLHEAFESSIGKDVVLKAPVSGEYHSSYILQSLRGDGAEQALVFYSLKADKTAVRFCLFEKQELGWEFLADFSGSGSEVYAVQFLDLLGNGQKELVISWTILESKTNKVMTVYSYQEEKKEQPLRAVLSETITAMQPMDLDADGALELFTLRQDVAALRPRAYARVFKMGQNGTVTQLAETRLDANISGYGLIQTEQLPGKTLRVFADAYKGEAQMLTELLYWDKKSLQLKTPLLDSKTLTNVKSVRNVLLPSMDIDKDGQIEIPRTVLCQGGKTITNTSAATAPYYLTMWVNFNNKGEQTRASYTALMQKEGYYILLDNAALREEVAVVCDEVNREMRLRQYNKLTFEYGEDLLVMKSVALSEAADQRYETYTRVFETETAVTMIQLTQFGLSKGLDAKFIQENIKQYEGAFQG